MVKSSNFRALTKEQQQIGEIFCKFLIIQFALLIGQADKKISQEESVQVEGGIQASAFRVCVRSFTVASMLNDGIESQEILHTSYCS